MESQHLTDLAQDERRPTYFIPRSAEAMWRAHFGGTLPAEVGVLAELPRSAALAKPVQIRERAAYSAMPYWLAVCILAATRRHNPIPPVPHAHSWPSAAALLMTAQTLERLTRTSSTPPT